MGRLVQPARIERVAIHGGGGFESTGGLQTVVIGGDSYLDKIAKFIPGEIVAAYMAIDRMLVPDAQSFQDKVGQLANAAPRGIRAGGTISLMQDPATQVWLYNFLPLGILLIGVIFTPLYIRQMAVNVGDTRPAAWRSHAIISTLAFVVWAYAIQGSAFTSGHLQYLYAGNWASALLVFFTLATGLFGPAPVDAQGSRG